MCGCWHTYETIDHKIEVNFIVNLMSIPSNKCDVICFQIMSILFKFTIPVSNNFATANWTQIIVNIYAIIEEIEPKKVRDYCMPRPTTPETALRVRSPYRAMFRALDSYRMTNEVILQQIN